MLGAACFLCWSLPSLRPPAAPRSPPHPLPHTLHHHLPHPLLIPLLILFLNLLPNPLPPPPHPLLHLFPHPSPHPLLHPPPPPPHLPTGLTSPLSLLQTPPTVPGGTDPRHLPTPLRFPRTRRPQPRLSAAILPGPGVCPPCPPWGGDTPLLFTFPAPPSLVTGGRGHQCPGRTRDEDTLKTGGLVALLGPPWSPLGLDGSGWQQGHGAGRCLTPGTIKPLLTPPTLCAT